ncbi:MAG: Hsp20/alpha crystallin family protein [Cyclobacteriaceae bacterium]
MKAEDRVLIKNLAHTAELVNTINGGMTEPIVNIEKLETEWLLSIRVPGINPDSLKIEIKDFELFLFNMILESNTSDHELPHMLAAVQLNGGVDVDGIMAEYEDGELLIRLPLDENTSGYERDVEIFRK